MKRRLAQLRVLAEWILGIGCLILGVIGWILPIMQGWLFIFLGLALLSRHALWARRLNENLKGMGRRVKDRLKKKRQNRTAKSGSKDAL